MEEHSNVGHPAAVKRALLARHACRAVKEVRVSPAVHALVCCEVTQHSGEKLRAEQNQREERVEETNTNRQLHPRIHCGTRFPLGLPVTEKIQLKLRRED